MSNQRNCLGEIVKQKNDRDWTTDEYAKLLHLVHVYGKEYKACAQIADFFENRSVRAIQHKMNEIFTDNSRTQIKTVNEFSVEKLSTKVWTQNEEITLLQLLR